MAILSNADRQRIADQWQRDNNITTGPMIKADLRAAVDGIDDLVDSIAADLNAAIPQPARGALTARQKAWLFFDIVRRRFEVS